MISGRTSRPDISVVLYRVLVGYQAYEVLDDGRNATLRLGVLSI